MKLDFTKSDPEWNAAEDLAHRMVAAQSAWAAENPTDSTSRIHMYALGLTVAAFLENCTYELDPEELEIKWHDMYEFIGETTSLLHHSGALIHDEWGE